MILRDRQALHARMSTCRCAKQSAGSGRCEGQTAPSHDGHKFRGARSHARTPPPSRHVHATIRSTSEVPTLRFRFPAPMRVGNDALSRRCCFRRKSFRSHSAGGGGKGGGRVAWSSKNLHPKNDPTLRPGHSRPFPQLQTAASRFAPSNFGADARGTHGAG